MITAVPRRESKGYAGMLADNAKKLSVTTVNWKYSDRSSAAPKEQ